MAYRSRTLFLSARTAALIAAVLTSVVAPFSTATAGASDNSGSIDSTESASTPKSAGQSTEADTPVLIDPFAEQWHIWGEDEEAQFVAKINQLRQSKGIGPLAIDGELTIQARIWTTTMSDAGDIFHTKNVESGITSNWKKLGENVGVGGSVDTLFQAFVDSPGHYKNLVDPEYTFVGVGVIWVGDRIYTAHRFMGVAPPAPPTTAPPVTAPPQTVPTTVAPPVAPAPTTTVAPPPAPPVSVPPPAVPAQVSLVIDTIGELLG